METVDYVEPLLGRELTADETVRAIRLVELGQALVESMFNGLTFDAGTETVDIEWHDPDVIWTPKYPVTAVSAINVGGIPLLLDFVRFDIKGKIELLDTGNTWIINGPPIWGWPVITVTYDFGFTDLPLDIVTAVAGMAADAIRRQSVNPDGLLGSASTLGDFSESFTYEREQAQQVGLIAPPDLASTLKRWARNRAVSIEMTRQR